MRPTESMAFPRSIERGLIEATPWKETHDLLMWVSAFN